MPKDNSLKVINCYTNEKIRNIIEGFLRDQAEYFQQTISVRREQVLLSVILPRDRYAKFWTECLYAKNKEGEFEFKIGDIMNNVFCHLAAGTDFKASQTEGTKLIVRFAYDELLSMRGGIRRVKDEYPYFQSALESVNEKLKFEAKKNDKLWETVEVRDAIKQFDHLIKGLEDDPDDFFKASDFTSYIYMTILNLWDFLGNYTHTFRLLACIARMQIWRDTAAGRIELREVLINATENWEYPNEK